MSQLKPIECVEVGSYFIVFKEGRNNAADDFLKEYIKLKAENEKLRKAVEFYANQWTSWEGVNGRTIVSQDREITEENRPSGGKLARATLKEIDGE